MPPLSALGPTIVRSPVLVKPVANTALLPKRLARTNPPIINQLSNTPDSRSGSTSAAVLTTSTTPVIIGGTPDSNAASVRAANFTSVNNTTGTVATTAVQQAANVTAVSNAKNGVISCLGSQGSSTSSTSTKCLTSLLGGLLTGNLLDVNAKSLLCSTISATQRAVKRQADAAGNSIIAAASKLSAASALQPASQTL